MFFIRTSMPDKLQNVQLVITLRINIETQNLHAICAQNGHTKNLNKCMEICTFLLLVMTSSLLNYYENEDIWDSVLLRKQPKRCLK